MPESGYKNPDDVRWKLAVFFTALREIEPTTPKGADALINTEIHAFGLLEELNPLLRFDEDETINHSEELSKAVLLIHPHSRKGWEMRVDALMRFELESLEHRQEVAEARQRLERVDTHLDRLQRDVRSAERMPAFQERKFMDRIGAMLKGIFSGKATAAAPEKS